MTIKVACLLQFKIQAESLFALKSVNILNEQKTAINEKTKILQVIREPKATQHRTTIIDEIDLNK